MQINQEIEQIPSTETITDTRDDGKRQCELSAISEMRQALSALRDVGAYGIAPLNSSDKY